MDVGEYLKHPILLCDSNSFFVWRHANYSSIWDPLRMTATYKI